MYHFLEEVHKPDGNCSGLYQYFFTYFRNPYDNNAMPMGSEPTYTEPNIMKGLPTNSMTLPRTVPQCQPVTYANGTLMRHPPKTYL